MKSRMHKRCFRLTRRYSTAATIIANPATLKPTTITTITTTSASTPTSPPTAPTDSAKFLAKPIFTVSPFDNVPRSKKTPVDQRILYSIYLQAVLRNDFNRLRTTLGKIARSASGETYLSCLQLLLNSFTAELVNVYNLQALYQDFSTQRKAKDKKVLNQIKSSFITKFVHCYSSQEGIDVASKVVRESIITIVETLITGSEPDLTFDGKHLKSFNEICKRSKKIKKRAVMKEAAIVNDELSIGKFKDKDGYVNLKSLCAYIASTSFEKGNKLYLHYDALEPEHQEDFFVQYNKFNEKRQLVVEDHMLLLMESLDGLKSAFQSTDKEIMYEWYSSCLKAYTVLLKRLNRIEDRKDLEADDVIFAKHLIQLNSVPKNTLVTLMLSNLVCQTMSSSKGYCTVISLTLLLLFSFKRAIIQNRELRNIPDGLLNISKEDGVQLFGSLLKLFIDECRFDAKNMQPFMESLSLAKDPEDLHSDFDTTLGPDHLYPAFIHSVRYKRSTGKRLGVVKIHPYLFHKLKSFVDMSFDRSLYLPMLCPPKPWSSPNEGGYLSIQKEILTSQDVSSSLKYLDAAHKSGQLDSTYHGLNVLSLQAWAVNSPVNIVFNKVMAYDQGFLKIPPKFEKLSTDTEYHDLKNVRIVIEMMREVANSFDANGDSFFLPHTLDFRGRAYPSVSLLSHHQDDLVRGLMMFWKSEPLGENGFNWLIYQLVGVFGKDKLLMNDRLIFFNEHKDDVLDSARHPLEGEKWWTSGEKPWQTLSLCIEIELVLNFEKHGGLIKNYKSRIPIHQDGSCNGLQHYAALGADLEGATAVNLAANLVKKDAYTTVLNVIALKIRQEVQTDFTKLSLKLLSRKLIKQTVMTTVYGVTRYGGAEQISHRIGEILQGLELKKQRGESIDLDYYLQLKENRPKLSMYISGLVLDSLLQLFAGATLLQKWLTESCLRIVDAVDIETVSHLKTVEREFGPANLFNRITFRPMQWTTVSGFPVVQMYKRTKLARLQTSLQNIAVSRPQATAPVDKRKQVNAIAPNFIHSIDSLHMFMTSVEVNSKGYSFAAVHDSYWTHAANVDDMSRILREQFVRLYETDIIEELRQDLVYLMRNSFQILWVERTANLELFNEIELLRDSKSKNLLDYSNVLIEEMKNNADITNLLNRYNPRRYILRGKTLVTYDNPDEKNVFKLKDYFPVLVPVEILDTPERGAFKVKEVLQSEYFFS